MRLQIFLSGAGLCSRRKALQMVFSGRISVNGRPVAEPSFEIDPARDVVTCDGRRVEPAPKIYVVLHKPKGVVTTVQDRFASRTVLDLLPPSLRKVYPVGRLDKDTSGLLILTNDGDLSQRLAHPSFGTKKVYRALLDRRLQEHDRQRLESGVVIEAEKTQPCQIRLLEGDFVEVVLREGRKRQVRKMFEVIGYEVLDLHRTSEGVLELKDLKAGAWRFLTEQEIARLKGENQ